MPGFRYRYFFYLRTPDLSNTVKTANLIPKILFSFNLSDVFDGAGVDHVALTFGGAVLTLEGVTSR
jgi:hypothetical protein